MIETPKNLTRNILFGMFLGFIIGSFFYYLEIFPESLVDFVRIYVFNLGSSIFVNLLKLLIFNPYPGKIIFAGFFSILFIQLLNKPLF